MGQDAPGKKTFARSVQAVALCRKTKRKNLQNNYLDTN
jgi:hypothetical protein